MRAGEGAESADLMRHEQGELAAYDGSGVYFGFWLLISTARPITPPPQHARFCSPLRAHVTCTNWRSREHKTQQKEAKQQRSSNFWSSGTEKRHNSAVGIGRIRAMATDGPCASSRRKPGRVVAPICNGSNHSGRGCQSERAVGLVRPWPLDVPSRNWTVACERLISEISGLYPEIRSTAPSTPRGRDPRRDLQAVALCDMHQPRLQHF